MLRRPERTTSWSSAMRILVIGFPSRALSNNYSLSGIGGNPGSMER
jgi:hypothetical protein